MIIVLFNRIDRLSCINIRLIIIIIITIIIIIIIIMCYCVEERVGAGGRRITLWVYLTRSMLFRLTVLRGLLCNILTSVFYFYCQGNKMQTCETSKGETKEKSNHYNYFFVRKNIYTIC